MDGLEALYKICNQPKLTQPGSSKLVENLGGPTCATLASVDSWTFCSTFTFDQTVPLSRQRTPNMVKCPGQLMGKIRNDYSIQCFCDFLGKLTRVYAPTVIMSCQTGVPAVKCGPNVAFCGATLSPTSQT